MLKAKEENIVLYVDDDQQNLDAFYYSFRRRCTILRASDTDEASELLSVYEVKVLICDQRMPNETGLDFIHKVHSLYPSIVTILMTAYSETEIMLDAINRVGLFRYILKPWQEQEVVMTLQNAFEKYNWNAERSVLLENLREQNAKLKGEKKRAEESATLIGAFLQNMSHEIRTPMNSIMGFSELILKKTLEEKDKNKYSKLVNISCRNLLSVINDIVLLSELQAGTFQINYDLISYKALAGELHYLFQESVKRYSKFDANLLMTIDDENREAEIALSAVLAVTTRLIDNAVKFTDGDITVFLFERNKESNGSLVVIVEDEGAGLEEAYYEKVFIPFFQVKKKKTSVVAGSGVGLSIVKKMAELMKGTISVESRKGKGTRFILEAPYKMIIK